MSRIHDQRSFLEVLRERGQLVTIERPVSLEYELADVTMTLERQNGPAPLFPRAGGDRCVTAVASNLLGSAERCAIALECSIEEVQDRTGQAINRPLPVERVEHGAFEDVVHTGDEVDLCELPIPTHGRKDGGAYVTGAVTIGVDPGSGRQNCSYTRAQVQGPRRLSILTNQWRHLRDFFDAAEKQGRELPLALTIGHDPAVLMAAGVRTPCDELEIAGALRGAPIPVARCRTVDLWAPASAEVVIEGVVRPGERLMEGPMAEFTQQYGHGWPVHVLEVTAICHRRDAVYHTMVPASFEHVNLGNVLPREGILKQFVTHIAADARVHLPPYGSGFMALVSMDKINAGQPRNVAMAALTSHPNINVCIVVDHDVDIYNPHEVMWALASRVDWAQDVFTIPHAQGHEMTPAADEEGIIGKVGIDATLRKGRHSEYPEKVAYGSVNLAEYLMNAVRAG